MKEPIASNIPYSTKGDIKFKPRGKSIYVHFLRNDCGEIPRICTCVSATIATELTITLNALHEADKQDIIESL